MLRMRPSNSWCSTTSSTVGSGVVSVRGIGVALPTALGLVGSSLSRPGLACCRAALTTTSLALSTFSTAASPSASAVKPLRIESRRRLMYTRSQLSVTVLARSGSRATTAILMIMSLGEAWKEKLKPRD